ncbi:MAG: FkbM family methyltransferase [Winogradskyella sp.]|uniref:FkbM family methyltransferase n=1 Tax=Winogradskyella sp. TaxID=1883156 RepID=UPI000F3E9D41|nr:FkbM family methyltransferase [Winogradskyella sp.]RNC86884.1 MAG: FkbM family methyltransferase [Winogradskyella sp.]
MKTFLSILKSYGLEGLKQYVKLFLGRIDYLRFKDSKFETIYIKGFLKPILLRTHTTDFSTFKQIFHNNEYDIQFDFNPRVIIDAGANIGLASLYFSKRYPEAKIFAIEPEVSNYAKLKETVDGYQNIKPILAALHHTEGEILEVFDQGVGHWGFATRKSDDTTINNTASTIDTISIPSLINKCELDIIDVLKIDIEGAEVEVFEKYFENWLPKVRCIIIEFHERFRPNSENKIKSVLSKFGFTSYKKGENWIFTNSIIAKD